jgi:CelD/BcsL family acetyltransferase involved in cellulose biosynthesis
MGYEDHNLHGAGLDGMMPMTDLSFTVVRRLSQAEPDWRALERDGTLTSYQRYDWLAAWTATIGRAEGVEPVILIARRGDRPAFVWPFGVSADGPVRVARWLGDEHCNYHVGIFAPGEMARLTEADTQRALDRTAREAAIDAFRLERQPLSWADIPNPIVGALPSAPSPSNGYSCSVPGSFESLLQARNGAHKRKKMRQKSRHMEEAGDFAIRTAASLDEARRVLDAFFAQKAERFAAAGIRDCFAPAVVRSFYGELLADAFARDRSLFGLRYLTAAGKPRAVMGMSAEGTRLSLLFLSYANDELARWSPGETLVFNVIEDACAAGFRTIDFGVGEERYKESWCDRTEQLFESYFPVTRTGWLYATAVRTRDGVKRSIKQNPAAWDLYKRFRKLRAS